MHSPRPPAPDESGILDAIAARPEDDTPRLVYADWLDERAGSGDHVRAEFIRLQCTVARSTAPAAGLLEREAELLAAVRSLVLGPLAEPAALVDLGAHLGPVYGPAGPLHTPHEKVEAVFRRGFLDELTLDAAVFVLAADAIAALRPVPAVGVSGVGAFLPAFLGCEHRTLITRARFQPDPDRGYLVGYDPRAFLSAGPWPRLTTLDLSWASLGNGDFRAGVIENRQLPALVDLNLFGNHLDRHILRFFTRSELWKRLRRLTWARNDCGIEGAEALAAAATSNLEYLNLHDCGVGPEHEQLLVARYVDRVRFDRPPIRMW